MDLGCFSLSLVVADIRKSLAFYETLGFEKLDGNIDQKWLVLKNENTKIGLFEGMFESNTLTFNPADARAVQARIKEAGYTLDKEADGDKGPAHMMVKDPDGNMILFDQY